MKKVTDLLRHVNQGSLRKAEEAPRLDGHRGGVLVSAMCHRVLRLLSPPPKTDPLSSIHSPKFLILNSILDLKKKIQPATSRVTPNWILLFFMSVSRLSFWASRSDWSRATKGLNLGVLNNGT